MVNINGPTEENSLVIGSVTRCMAKVYSHGRMVEDMKENTTMIRNKEMEFSYGRTEGNMMVHG